MAYDFAAMSPQELRVALSGPTGSTFLRHIATAALNKCDELQMLLDHDEDVREGTFGWVLEGLIEEGKRFRRAGWNGKGMFIFLVDASRFKVNREPLMSILGEGTEVSYHAHIDLKSASGEICMWTPSIADLMATDWEVI